MLNKVWMERKSRAHFPQQLFLNYGNNKAQDEENRAKKKTQ